MQDWNCAQDIAGIPLTAANYTHAVEILKTLFGWPKLVAREHISALWKAPACREMTMQGIQILVDELMKHLRCLKALDKEPYTGHFPVSEALMPMLREKFSPALQSAWDLKVGSDDDFKKFLQFAQRHAQRSPRPWKTASESLRRESNTEPSRRNRLTSNGITAAVLRRLLRQGGRRSIWNINN
ncbi:hypothetical protein T07_14469 [Trichinella nelsoni]|uniref:Uncharacterized protein n=1 Tax=Trichinella nelsoni TaxID=6336 RepID=A0A0V0SFJ7_9BILA|nr:hypothetical protein T07_14469 [Trichinella nelsoni]